MRPFLPSFVRPLILAFLLCCRPTLAADQPAAAKDASFTLVNHTGAAIVSLRLSPSLTDKWGDNLLGKNPIADQNETPIPYAANNQTELWDLRTTDQKDEETEWPGVSLTDSKKIVLSFAEDEPIVTYE